MWQIHIIIHPAHASKLREFWGDGIGASSFLSSLLLLMPLFIASLPMSMLLANAIVRFIPCARRILDKETEGVKWASYREATSGLWAIARIIVPICMFLSFIGAATLANLR
jgi:hypothetical protein